MPPSPPVALLSQGEELLTGQILDTNTAWLAERLSGLGFRVLYAHTTPDEPGAITRAIRAAYEAADVLICTGGLGPTDDDLTAACAAEAAGLSPTLDRASLERIEALYARHRQRMPESNAKQAMIPAGARVLANDWGTAPGFELICGDGVGYFLPGVPQELRAFWEAHVRPALLERFAPRPLRRVVLRCIGIPESSLGERMRPLAGEPGLSISFRTTPSENQVTLTFGPSVDPARIERTCTRAREAIGGACFGVDSGPIAQVVGEALAERGETLATAESCTGGRISALITAVPGASRYFIEGACVYANEAKIRTCAVDPEALTRRGAVSEIVARQLAEGIRARAGTTYGLSTTGVAGPGGGSPEKPVGTVYIALATPSGTTCRRLSLGGDRERITTMAASLSLDLLRRHLKKSGIHQPPVSF